MSDFVNNTLIAALRDVIREELNKMIPMVTQMITESDSFGDTLTEALADTVRDNPDLGELKRQVEKLCDEDVEQRISDLETSVEDLPDFDGIDSRLDDLENETPPDLDEIKSEAKDHEERLDALESKVDEHGSILQRFRAALDGFWHNGM